MTDGRPTVRSDERLAFWERSELRFVAGLGYVLLGLSLLLDLGARGGLTGGLAVDAGLAAATSALMVALDRGPYRWLTHRDERVGLPAAGGGPVPTLAFALLIALMATLVVRQPLYGFFSFTGYFWVFRLLGGRVRLLGVALVATLSAISQTGSFPYDGAARVLGLVVVYLINAGVAGSLSWYGVISDEQQQRRARRISALTEANERLEQSLQRNAELQQRVVAQAREAGVAQERGRMAREIHDTLAQGLTGIVTQLQAAQRAGTATAPGADHVATAIELARDSLTEARRSVAALTPEPLVAARLPEAVREVAERWARVNELPVAITTTGTARVMRPEIEVALLRTAQEALANVAKHARASRVGLTLSYMEDLVTLDVRDDGVGFRRDGAAPRAPSGHGFGLESMRQRVESVAGTFLVESEPDAGTAISASVPAAPA